MMSDVEGAVTPFGSVHEAMQKVLPGVDNGYGDGELQGWVENVMKDTCKLYLPVFVF